MGAFGCHDNQFWSNLPQNLMQPFPYPIYATYKIWPKDWQTDLRDIHVWKCK